MISTLIYPRFFLTLGGLFGFLVAFVSGLLAGAEISLAVRDTSIGCVLGAFLVKGVLQVVTSSIQTLEQEKSKGGAAQDDNSDAELNSQTALRAR